MHMNYSQFMSLPVPICLEKWGVMTPQLLWERHPWSVPCFLDKFCENQSATFIRVILFRDRQTN